MAQGNEKIFFPLSLERYALYPWRTPHSAPCLILAMRDGRADLTGRRISEALHLGHFQTASDKDGCRRVWEDLRLQRGGISEISALNLPLSFFLRDMDQGHTPHTPSGLPGTALKGPRWIFCRSPHSI